MTDRVASRLALRAGSLSRWVCIGAIALLMAACGGGGGGGNDVAPPPPPPGGSGTGADGVPVFWNLYGYNEAAGAALAVRETADGGFIGTGYQLSLSFTGPLDLHVLKTDRLGTTQWQRRIPVSGGATGSAVQPIASGGYMVAATTGSDASSRIMLLRLDAAGNTVSGWPKTYGGSAARQANALHAVNGGADGFVVVGVGDAGPPIGTGLYVLRVAADGSVLWDKIDYAAFCAGAMGTGAAITATDNGSNYVIAGRTGCFQWAGFLIKISATDGAEIWRKSFDGANPAHYASLDGVVSTTDGSLVASGRTGSDCGSGTYAGNCDALVIKTDAAGNELWRRLYGGALEGQKDAAAGVTLAPDGSYLVAGVSRSYGGTILDQSVPFFWDDVMVIKVTPAGATTWQKIKGLRPRGADGGLAIATVSDGGFVVAGGSGGVVMLAKFDKDGVTANLGASYDLTYNVPTTLGVISTNNALDVAGVGASALIAPRELGGALLDELVAASGGSLSSSFCTGGGSYAFVPAVPATLVQGGSYVMTFTNCVFGPTGDLVRINGNVTLAVDSVSGAPSSGSYALQMTVSNLALNVEEPGTSPLLAQAFAGGLRIARTATAGNLAETITSPTGTALSVTEVSGGTPMLSATLSSMNLHYAVPTSGAVTIGQAGDSVSVGAAGNTFAVGVLTAISMPANGQPTAGVYRVTAQDGSRLMATLSSNGTDSTASLAIDTNGDGTDEGAVSYPWDFIY